MTLSSLRKPMSTLYTGESQSYRSEISRLVLTTVHDVTEVLVYGNLHSNDVQSFGGLRIQSHDGTVDRVFDRDFLSTGFSNATTTSEDFSHGYYIESGNMSKRHISVRRHFQDIQNEENFALKIVFHLASPCGAIDLLCALVDKNLSQVSNTVADSVVISKDPDFNINFKSVERESSSKIRLPAEHASNVSGNSIYEKDIFFEKGASPFSRKASYAYLRVTTREGAVVYHKIHELSGDGQTFVDFGISTPDVEYCLLDEHKNMITDFSKLDSPLYNTHAWSSTEFHQNYARNWIYSRGRRQQ